MPLAIQKRQAEKRRGLYKLSSLPKLSGLISTTVHVGHFRGMSEDSNRKRGGEGNSQGIHTIHTTWQWKVIRYAGREGGEEGRADSATQEIK